MSHLKPWLIAFAACFLLLVGLVGFEQLYRTSIESRWPQMVGRQEEQMGENIRLEFSRYQENTASELTGILARTQLADKLLRRQDIPPGTFFELLLGEGRPSLALELFGEDKQTMAWAGNRGTLLDTQRLDRSTSSFVLQGPIYSTLVVVLPVTAPGSGTVLGYLVGRRLFDVNYPINNRFINAGAFRATFTSRLSAVPEFDFSVDSQPLPSDTRLSVPLVGLDGTRIGYAYLKRSTLEGQLEEFHRLMGHLEALSCLLGVIIASIVFFRWWLSLRSVSLRIILVTAVLWGFRYLLVGLDLPGGITGGEIFDPRYFASPLGFGIARSIGDVFISACILMPNVYLVLNLSLGAPGREADDRTLKRGRSVRTLGLALLAFLVLLLTRALPAIVTGAVVDSTLSYNDPTSVIPSFQLSVMLLALMLIALSFVLLAAVLIFWSHRLARSLFLPGASPLTPWLAVGGIFLCGSVLFGLLQQTPLLDQPTRLIMLAALVAISVWLIRRRKNDTRFLAVSSVAAFLILAPLLIQNLSQQDRSHVELLAEEYARPEDNWMTFLTTRSLDELSGSEAERILTSGDTDEIDKMAFTQWAHSMLSREGNNCAVTYIDSAGNVLSDFSIGLAQTLSGRAREEALPAVRTVHTETRVMSGISVRLLKGYTPIRTPEGALLGGVWVVLSSGRQTLLLRGETNDILRNTTREKFEAHYRPLIFSEYFQGKLLYTTSQDFPLDRPLPAALYQTDTLTDGLWLNEDVEGGSYETFFLRDQKNGEGGSWIALSMLALDTRWYLYSFLRSMVFYLFVGAAAAIVLRIGPVVRMLRPRASFRMKLMVAFIAVSIIPVVILWYFNRQYASERMQNSATRRLMEQTSAIVIDLQQEMGMTVPAVLGRLTDEQCMDVANSMNTDFNVYFGTRFLASSKPEMFTAQLVDPTLSAGAFLNLVLKRKAFFSETQAIGTLLYVVGYRPLEAEDGSVLGVVAVPTLYRQNEIDEDLTRRNVFLFGSYTIALLLSVLAGTVFANQISSPIRRLRSATARIAAGDLDVSLRTDARDELGDLERSFHEMTRDLVESQEKMARTERELAWKEMAKQVAHEIKNPLTPMKLSIQHLRQAYRDGVKDFGSILEQVSSTVLEQIEALSRIASEFSHFARMPERSVEPVSVNEVLTEAANVFRQLSGIRFVTALDKSDPLVTADREELRRAFMNIARNAVQAMEEHGTLTLETRAEGTQVTIRITDTGPGMPPEVRRHLFQPNFSTKTDGMGMGLAIVKKIIDDLGGTIIIESTPGSGTSVLIRLPGGNEKT